LHPPARQWGDNWIAAHPILTIGAFLVASLLASRLLLGGIGRSWLFPVFFGTVSSALVVWNARTRVHPK
jgi:hypothetical protein